MPINQNLSRQYSGLELFAKGVVEGFLTGLHRSPYHGFSVEFSEHRSYNSGESTKNVDWKLYGKTDRLYVKKYEEETNLRCQLVIDNSSSMYFPVDGGNRAVGQRNKMDFSIHAAAAFMQLLKTQRDASGLSIYNEKLELHLPAKVANSHLQLMTQKLDELIDSKPTIAKSTNTVQALHEIAEKIPRRSLVILFSDFFDGSKGTEELFLALQHLRHNHHEIIIFNVTDKQSEYDLAFENRPHTFVDMETGEKVNLNPSQLKTHYQKATQAFEKELKIRCGQFQIDYNLIDIQEGFSPLFLAYLAKRARMIR